MLLAGLAPSWALFAGALFVVGALDSVVDVAQNTHGLRVQRLYGRSIINSFHAIWSLGPSPAGSWAARPPRSTCRSGCTSASRR